MADLLVQACLAHDFPEAERLLAAGVNPNAPTSDGWSPLYAACNSSDHLVVQFLLSLGAVDPNKTNLHDPSFPLLRAAGLDSEQCLCLLLADERTNVNQADETGITPLIFALKVGRFVNSTFLLRHPGCDLNATDNQGYCPLAYAVLQGARETAVELISNPKVDVEQRTHFYNESPFDIACLMADYELVKTFLALRPVVNAYKTMGQLLWLLLHGHDPSQAPFWNVQPPGQLPEQEETEEEEEGEGEEEEEEEEDLELEDMEAQDEEEDADESL